MIANVKAAQAAATNEAKTATNEPHDAERHPYP
jgi:hypothetical protein